MTSVREGAFYGWPYSYWDQNVDPRVGPQNPVKVQSALRPDYSLGSHHAPLGIAFSNAAMGGQFGVRAFVRRTWQLESPNPGRLPSGVRAFPGWPASGEPV